MKKYLFPIVAIAATIGFASCLKDKGYENQTYGIQISEQNGVSFPQATSSPVDIGLNSSTSAQTFSTSLSVEGNAAKQDIKVTLVLNPTNVANAGLTLLPASAYTAPLTVTIPAGKNLSALTITVPNSTTLDPTINYGLGFSIATVDGGYVIAKNMKDVVFSISIKNKFDGVYQLKSKMLNWNNPSDPASNFGIANTPWTWPGDVLMITSGPSSVKMFDDWGFIDYIHPIQSTTAWSAFGSTAPKFTFEPTTNVLTAASNDFPNPPNGRTFQVNPAVTTSRWDPATKNIYAAIIMKQPGRSDLQIFDTLIYVRPR